MTEDNALAASETAAPPAEVEKPAEVSQEIAAQTDETATESKPEDVADDAKETKAKPKGRAQERIEELARRDKNNRRTIARLNQEIGRLRAEAPPKEEDFADASEYQRATFKRATREASLEQQFEAVSADVDSLKEERKQAWAERTLEARERMPDFESVFNDTVPVSEPMADMIVQSDVGPELAYWLGKNRSVAHRIAQMSPLEAAREIGRLEARLTAPSPKTVSSAPKPVQTVAGKAHSAGKAPEDMSYDEYRAMRQAQIKARRGY